MGVDHITSVEEKDSGPPPSIRGGEGGGHREAIYATRKTATRRPGPAVPDAHDTIHSTIAVLGVGILQVGMFERTTLRTTDLWEHVTISDRRV